jgi:hypothetical protein
VPPHLNSFILSLLSRLNDGQSTCIPPSFLSCESRVESQICDGIDLFNWQVRDVFLRSRLYRARAASPLNPSVHTRCSSSNPQSPRYPCVEGILDYPGIQTHIHDIYVIIRHRRATSTFRIFFKRHLLLPLNHVLDVQGDMLIMRVASKSRSSVVNMRGSDWRLADFIVKR